MSRTTTESKRRECLGLSFTSQLVADEVGQAPVPRRTTWSTRRFSYFDFALATQYTTAATIAETGASIGGIGKADFAYAYLGTNASGGDGKFNDTSGNASSQPSSAVTLPTAILATGRGFQDAEAASTLAYAERLPVLLTTPSTLSSQASSAITKLGIKQVIVMGGPLAVSNGVVSAVQSLGASVLRIAGSNYTDTSVQLAKFETTSSATGLGWTGTGSVTVARGDFFTDGLAGAVVAADGPSSGSPTPLLLTQSPTSVGTALGAFLHTAGSTGIGGARVMRFTVLGGPLAVTQTTINAMGADL